MNRAHRVETLPNKRVRNAHVCTQRAADTHTAIERRVSCPLMPQLMGRWCVVCLFLELRMNAVLLPANCVTLLWSRLIMYRYLCRASLIYQCWFDGCTLLWLHPLPAVCFRLQAFNNKLGLLSHPHSHTQSAHNHFLFGTFCLSGHLQSLFHLIGGCLKCLLMYFARQPRHTVWGSNRQTDWNVNVDAMQKLRHCVFFITSCSHEADGYTGPVRSQ